MQAQHSERQVEGREASEANRPPRVRERWSAFFARALVATVVTTLAVFAIAPQASTQEQRGAEAFVGVFDDPTSLARAIDARVASVVADCMDAANQPYFLSIDARFDLTEVSFEDALDPGLERSFADLVPQLVDPSDLVIDPSQVLVDPLLLQPDLLVDPDTFNLAYVPEFVDDQALFQTQLTDTDVRIQPQTEGYAIALVGYDVIEPDPNLEVVENLDPMALDDYEAALYGVRLTDLAEGETGGCSSEGFDVLTDEIIPELERRDAELAELERLILDDPGFERALVEWRACVVDSGISGLEDVTTLDDAVALTNDRFVAAGTDADLLAEARDFEIELATIDFACRAVSTDLAAAAVVTNLGVTYVGGVENSIARFEEGS